MYITISHYSGQRCFTQNQDVAIRIYHTQNREYTDGVIATIVEYKYFCSCNHPTFKRVSEKQGSGDKNGMICRISDDDLGGRHERVARVTVSP